MSIEQQIKRSVSLAPFTTFHIGGPADYFFIASSMDDLMAGVRWGKEKQLPVFILGSGANILISDKGFRGLVVKNEAKKCQMSNVKYPISNGSKETQILLTAESGVTIKELIEQTSQNGWSGLEHYAGIPSTLGGAIWQNLHFLGPDRKQTMFISDIVENAKILTHEDQIKDVDRDYFQFDYDWSEIHKTHDIVLSVTLGLLAKPKEEINKQIAANLQWRNEKHPFEAWKNSAGSIFKKIEGYGAGRLIDQVGLKGHQIGGARISEKHANFIVNINHATAKDVRELIELVQKTVKEKIGLVLEPEITFVGEF